jgi:hypothetical protein
LAAHSEAGGFDAANCDQRKVLCSEKIPLEDWKNAAQVLELYQNFIPLCSLWPAKQYR